MPAQIPDRKSEKRIRNEQGRRASLRDPGWKKNGQTQKRGGGVGQPQKAVFPNDGDATC